MVSVPVVARSFNSRVYADETFASMPIVHEDPTQAEVTYMAQNGFFSKVHSGQVTVPQQDALKAAEPWMKQFPGDKINVQVVDMSRKINSNEYGSVDDDTKMKDPHAESGLFKDVPVYDIRINNVHLNLHGQDTTPQTLHVIVNATTGQVMFGFAVHGPTPNK
jgi:SUMO ligase MMS21 Smc5/6 complex component